jgi:hypothetical protein
VLSCRVAESEARLSYAALGDLLDFELPDLPAPQKRALDAALLRAEVEGAPPDQRAVSIASLGVVRALAASGPVLIAIDDVQWLDVPSARVLAFVVRRLEDAPIRILVALRVGCGGDPLGLGQAGPALSLHRVAMGPLREEAMTRLLRDRTGGDLVHPILLRLHRISEGNPFFALEITRALTRQGVRPAPGEPLPVPEDLQELLGARLAALPPSVADGLLVVAAAARPREDLVVAAAARRERASAGIERAKKAGILQRAGGRIGFTHPLLGSTVYAAATSQARRSVHRRLADLVVDPEERARHLALAASGPDLQVARALQEAGRHARGRGAPDAAAELLELARKLTPSGDGAGLLRRSVEAAEYHFDAGDATHATALLEEAIAMARPGRDRARILFRLASISWLDMRRVQGLSEQALREVGDDAAIRAAILEHLAWVGIYRGDLAFASEHARASRQWARRIADPAIRGDSLSTFAMVEFLLRRPAQDPMAEAVQLEDLAMREVPGGQTTVFTAARTCHGLQLLWAGELDAAREVLHQELTVYERLGRYVVRDELLCYLAEVECRAGNWAVAARHAQEAHDIDVESGRVLGQGHMLFPRALVAALTGDVDAARWDAEEGLRQCLRNEDILDATCHRAVLGFLELSLSNPTAAMERLEPVLAFLDELGSSEPGVIPCPPDAIEALVSLGRLEEAEALLDRLERQGRTLDRPWAAHRGPGRSFGGALGAGASHGGTPACAAALRAGPDPAGEGRGGAQSQAEASRPLDSGAGACSLSGPRRAVVGAAGARRPRPCRRCGAAVQRAHPHRAADRPAGGGREEEPRGRRCPIHLREDRRGEPVTDLPQARGSFAHRTHPPDRRQLRPADHVHRGRHLAQLARRGAPTALRRGDGLVPVGPG